tara:strand:+ start:1435 stop:1581 length:147 start_codon:yes stop_codon:yes gene_type:complete
MAWVVVPKAGLPNIGLKGELCSEQKQKPVAYMIKQRVIYCPIEPHAKR